MEILSYVVSSLAWSVGGFAIGFILGRMTVMTNEVHEIKEQVVSHTPERRRKRDWMFSTQWLGVALLILALGTAIQSIIANDRDEQLREENNRLIRCQQSFANSLADALDARTKANTEATEALDSLITDLTDPINESLSEEEREAKGDALVDEYLATRKAARETILENPYPPAPRNFCD